MNIKQPQYTFSALALAVVVGLSGPAQAQSAAGSSPGAAAPSAASKAAQPQVDDKAAREAEKKRAELTQDAITALTKTCLLYTSPSPRDRQKSRMPSSA